MKHRKRTYKQVRDLICEAKAKNIDYYDNPEAYIGKVANNKRYDEYTMDPNDEAEEQDTKNYMLYDETEKKRTKAKRMDVLMRMVKAYAKNKREIDKKSKEGKPLTQNQRRMLKVADLVARSGQNGSISWSGLR